MPDVAEERPAKDARFTPSRIPISDATKAIVADVRRQLLNYEKHLRLRQRARTPDAQARFDRIVSAIVCDLMHAALADPGGWRHISLSKRHSGTQGVGAPFMTEERIKIIQWMSTREMDWLELEKGGVVPFGRNRQSRIRASARLRTRMDRRGIRFEDFGRDASLMGDPTELRSVKVRGNSKSVEVPTGEPAETFRAQMLRINEWLAEAQVDCFPDSEGNERDVGDRWMRRIFNNERFDQGGRLYGGFWQAMSAEDRVSDIRLAGESVVSLDFGQCGVRIAYGIAGAQPPEGDLYLVPRLARFREGVKVFLNAMLAQTERMKRRPAGSGKKFPRHFSIEDIESRIFEHHHAIRHLCYTGLGWTLQYMESQVLVHTMLELMKKSIPALPIHDCLLAPASTAEAVQSLMLQSFKQITGAEGIITIQGYPLVTLRAGGDRKGGSINEGDIYSSPSPPHKRGT